MLSSSISEILTENVSQMFSQYLPKQEALTKKGCEMTTLEFVTPVCLVGVETSEKMGARKSERDGSDCPLCNLHDGDHSSLQVAQGLSLFG